MTPSSSSPSSPSSQVVVVRDDPNGGMMNPRGSGGENNLLMPLMEQFGVMQQQMFDQFHRTMMMMMQMFSTMHQEQATLLREEMRVPEGDGGTADGPEGAGRRTSGNAGCRRAAPARRRRTRCRPRETGAGASAGAAVSHGAAATPGKLEGGRVGVASWHSPGGACADGRARAGQTGPAEDEEVHDWLTERIAHPECERQSRWRRIMSFIRSS